MSDERDFHVEEYKSLRDQMLMYISSIHTEFRFYATGWAVITGWVFTSRVGNVDSNNPEVAIFQIVSAWLPLLISLWYNFRSNWIKSRIGRLSSYIRDIENIYGREGLGWENHIFKAQKRKSVLISRSVSLMNLFSVIFGMAITFLYSRQLVFWAYDALVGALMARFQQYI